MKKILLFAFALFGISAFAQEQGNDNGLGIKLNVGLVGDRFAEVSYKKSNSIWSALTNADVNSNNPYVDRKNTPLFGLTLDSRWYVANPGKFGIAINARWLDASFSASKIFFNDFKGLLKNLNGQEILKGKTVKADALGVGPMGTFYPTDNMAIDIYYNLCPSLTLQNFEFADENMQETYKKAAELLDYKIDDLEAEFGLSHYIGGAFRYKIFQVGVEYNIAKPKSVDWFDDNKNTNNQYFNLSNGVSHTRRNSFRIFLGFKF